eukprot:CAMPEP_0180703908 /NCGR_PEP_ID=MMETSP1038_2-20121128/6876_1 /TAXON_ID=632150 /ORGANISM="Azadinium spinosum, Strain 3D9" /LENGTH=453 /DNA_ID=CAMNT_0022735711 /DNA_START=1 /DNA_END=1358 /DNA_ORIENTATION=+
MGPGQPGRHGGLAAAAAEAAMEEEEEGQMEAVGAGSGSGGASDDPIPDKVGVEIHLSKKERKVLKKLECSMCKAIIREMHAEVVKHGMTKGGVGAESQVWETSNAICLAMLQKYKLDLTAPSLEAKAEDEDDEQAMMGAGGDPAAAMRSMLVLKMGCSRWVEDYGSETSGYIFKVVREGSNTAEGAAQDFCVRSVGLCGSNKAERRQKAKEQEKHRQQKRAAMMEAEEKTLKKQKEADPMSALPEDSKFGLQRMLEMAKDDPLHYMEDDAKERIQHKSRSDLRCDVCRAVLDEVHQIVAKRPKSMRREYDILPFMEGACEGGKDLSVPNYFGVEPPPLPPVWTDRYRPRLEKKSGRWALRRFPKKAAKARRKWRELSKDGKQKPPSSSENEGDMMLTLTCKDILEPEHMAEALYGQMVACSDGDSGCDPSLAAARALCRATDGTPCAFGAEVT